jgi:hypothetical protein
VQPVLPSVEAASSTQQTEPQSAAGGGKKEKERQRKERQRQRRMEEAREALQVAMDAMLDARCVNPVWLMRRTLAGTLSGGGGGGGGGDYRAAATGGGGDGAHTGNAARRAEAAAGAGSAGRATGGTHAPGWRGAVRAVPGRAQGPHHRTLWPSVRVRGVCGGAEEGQTPSVPFLPDTHQLHVQGVRSLNAVRRSTAPTLLLERPAPSQ